jgi:Polyphosphate kinase 2 (PPK2)
MNSDPARCRLRAETAQSPQGWLSRNDQERSSANKSLNGINEPPTMRRAAKGIKLNISSKHFRVREGDDIDLKKWPTKVEPAYKWKDQYRRLLREHVAQLSSQQQLLYASNRYAVLLIFQAMDAAGKDGAIKHVMSGVNPQGCQVFSSKHPNPIEFQHDFLWRSIRNLPERGRIGIFNRSYYEEVLIARVHPEILHGEGFPDGRTTTTRYGKTAIARLRIWRNTSTATAPESSRFFFTFPRKNSAGGFWHASTSRKRIGNSAAPTSSRENSGSSI